jgi:hypothetical protein
MGSPVLNDSLYESIKDCMPILFDDFHRILVCENDKLLAFQAWYILCSKIKNRFEIQDFRLVNKRGVCG